MTDAQANAHPEAVVEARAVVRTYAPRKRPPRPPIRALDAVDLRVNRGEFVALLGPNGSGKSTLMRLIATTDTPDEGEVLVDGHSTRTAPARARAALGVVFQRPGLDNLLTVRENLQAQGALVGLRTRDARARALTVAEEVGLSDRLDDRVGRLSGGLARRADLARALVGDPRILLLDEPTTGLDIAARQAFLETVRARRAQGVTVVMSTHLMDEAEHADRVALMSAGRIVAFAPPAELVKGDAERIVEARLADAGELELAGLRVTRADSRAVGMGTQAQVEDAVLRLTRAGAAFRVGPITLADAYLRLTGATLDAETAP